MMATETNPKAPPIPGPAGGDRLAAARAARKPADPNKPKMDAEQSFLFRAIGQAKAACSLLQKRLRAGGTISADAARACTTLSGEYAGLIGDE